MQKNKEVIKELKMIFTQGGNAPYFGENVSQFEHAAQSLMLVISDEQAIDMQVAAFLHDIGHLLETSKNSNEMDIYGRKDHEEAAQLWLLEKGFSKKNTL